MYKTIRWQQRFSNYSKAIQQLQEAVSKQDLSNIERAGRIKFFEFTFELAWKTLKDYLEADGYLVKSPRETLKQAFQNGIIENGQLWLQALDDRNLAAHTYDDETSEKISKLISDQYFELLKNLHDFLKNKIPI